MSFTDYSSNIPQEQDGPWRKLLKNRPPQSRIKKRRPQAKPAKEPLSKASDWDRVARWYDSVVGEDGSFYQKNLIFPKLLKLLQLQKEEQVLDLACGQGAFCRYLDEKGFSVLGGDLSRELIRMAKARSSSNVLYSHFDAGDPEALEGNRYDAISCILALQNMEQLSGVFQNIHRWLKVGGRFVLVIMHPCFRIPRQSHWGWDEEKKLQYRRVDRYQAEMTIPILTPPLDRSKLYTQTYHRPLESYVRELASAGLCITALEEWVSNKTSQPGKRSRAENLARKEFPMFLAMRAEPISQKR